MKDDDDGTFFNIKFTDGECEKWSKEDYDRSAKDAVIPVGAVGYKFVQKFKCRGSYEPFNGDVISILNTSKNCKCRFNDNTEHHYSYGQFHLRSKNEEGGDDGDSNYSADDDDIEMYNMTGSRKMPPAETDETTKGIYFENLAKHSTEVLESFGTIKETFTKAMQTPIDKIARRYEQMEVDGKHMKVVPWPGDDDVQILTDLLKGIDPGFGIDIHTWGQFKSNMPILYEWYQTHVLFHDYLTEIVACDKAGCNVCRAFGVGLRTPVTYGGRLRYVLLRPMDRPVVT